MPVELHFDANQPFQQDAIESVIGLLDGQTFAPAAFEIGGQAQGVLLTDHGTGNALVLDISTVSDNLRRIQERNNIPPSMRLAVGAVLDDLDFTTEMETGTGKTYVYLRTALELNKTYGFSKFLVVVPSVAIREGVLSNLRLLKEHFRIIYGGIAYDSLVYSSDRPAELRSYAQSNQMQILVINIDAFNKTGNVIYQGRDNTMGIPPIEFIQATRPIVILDEPQNLEGEAAKQGIAALHPMMTLRYSATHRSMPNPIYRLTPVDAYLQGLVKRIEVWPVREDEDLNKPYVKVVSIRSNRRTVTAELEIDVAADTGPVRKKVSIAPGRDGVLPDLYDLSGGRDMYRGYAIEDIRADLREVAFGNGIALREGDELGADEATIQRITIRTAVQQHLDRERDLGARYLRGEIPSPIKPLTLFFIDRVANYHPIDGKFRTWFVEAYEQLRTQARYADLGLPSVDLVHDGYFAEDRHGPKDTSGNTQADDAAYEKIMRRKDVLLSPDEPLRFIWSHSALREGWDNPNVFVIATLNETRSPIKKRQEIGRGLRLPVMANGERCKDPEVARLVVVANESYDEFASALQREIETDTATTFDKRNVKNARQGRPVTLREQATLDPAFKELWDRISRRTRYQVDYDTDRLIETAAARLALEPAIASPMIRVEGALLVMDARTGVSAEVISTRNPIRVSDGYPIPDILGHLSNELPLSRRTISQILIRSGKLSEATVNPQRFIDQARAAIKQALADEMLAGVKYTPIASDEDGAYAMSLLTERPATSYEATPIRLERSALDEVMVDSDVEAAFASALDTREGVEWFIKLPWWFKVETPIGNYNPDWAVVISNADGETRCYLVRETKGATTFAALPTDQQLKIGYGSRHFEAIAVDYTWLSSADDMLVKNDLCERLPDGAATSA